ncbi:single-stranded DNA-binding protein [Escherichia coli]
MPRPETTVRGRPQKFLPASGQKVLRDVHFTPGLAETVVAVMPLAAKVLKRVMVNTGGNKRQVPAKRQNRGSRNSTGDGG